MTSQRILSLVYLDEVVEYLERARGAASDCEREDWRVRLSEGDETRLREGIVPEEKLKG